MPSDRGPAGSRLTPEFFYLSRCGQGKGNFKDIETAKLSHNESWATLKGQYKKGVSWVRNGDALPVSSYLLVSFQGFLWAQPATQSTAMCEQGVCTYTCGCTWWKIPGSSLTLSEPQLYKWEDNPCPVYLAFWFCQQPCQPRHLCQEWGGEAEGRDSPKNETWNVFVFSNVSLEISVKIWIQLHICFHYNNISNYLCDLLILLKIFLFTKCWVCSALWEHKACLLCGFMCPPFPRPPSPLIQGFSWCSCPAQQHHSHSPDTWLLVPLSSHCVLHWVTLTSTHQGLVLCVQHGWKACSSSPACSCQLLALNRGEKLGGCHI